MRAIVYLLLVLGYFELGSSAPTTRPTTARPTKTPTPKPTKLPTTKKPTTKKPTTKKPTTKKPVVNPTAAGSTQPPSLSPTVTSAPTVTASPTPFPTSINGYIDGGTLCTSPYAEEQAGPSLVGGTGGFGPFLAHSAVGCPSRVQTISVWRGGLDGGFKRIQVTFFGDPDPKAYGSSLDHVSGVPDTLTFAEDEYLTGVVKISGNGKSGADGRVYNMFFNTNKRVDDSPGDVNVVPLHHDIYDFNVGANGAYLSGFSVRCGTTDTGEIDAMAFVLSNFATPHPSPTPTAGPPTSFPTSINGYIDGRTLCTIYPETQISSSLVGGTGGFGPFLAHSTVGCPRASRVKTISVWRGGLSDGIKRIEVTFFDDPVPQGYGSSPAHVSGLPDTLTFAEDEYLVGDFVRITTNGNSGADGRVYNMFFNTNKRSFVSPGGVGDYIGNPSSTTLYFPTAVGAGLRYLTGLVLRYGTTDTGEIDAMTFVTTYWRS